MPVEEAYNFEQFLDDSVEEAGATLFACDSAGLHESLRGWEIMSDRDEDALSRGSNLAAFEPPVLSEPGGNVPSGITIVDKSEPVVQMAAKAVKHRASAAPSAAVSEAMRLTDKKQLRFPREKGRLARLFGDQGRLAAKLPRLSPARSQKFCQLSV